MGDMTDDQLDMDDRVEAAADPGGLREAIRKAYTGGLIAWPEDEHHRWCDGSGGDDHRFDIEMWLDDVERALAATPTGERALDVHVNTGSAHDAAMSWSEGHTAGYEEAEQALREMLVAIPATGLLEGANRYDTDDQHVLHVWRDGVSWDIECALLDPTDGGSSGS